MRTDYATEVTCDVGVLPDFTMEVSYVFDDTDVVITATRNGAGDDVPLDDDTRERVENIVRQKHYERFGH